MKTLANTLLFLVLLSMCACSQKEEAPPAQPVVVTPAPAPVPESCTTFKAEALFKAKYQGFTVVFTGTAADKATLSKPMKGADGQLLGRETHEFLIKDKAGACELTECVSTREVGGQKLVNDFCAKRSQFYQNGALVYEDTPLDNGLWHRKYSGLDKIPTKVPNWATPDGMDLYMTWVLRPNKKASHVPVWPAQAIWQRAGDDITLMAGQATLKNPTKGVSSDELYTFMRTNGQGEVVSSGVLAPVSQASFKAYLAFLKKEQDSWERDHSGDSAAMLAFNEGPVKHSRVRSVPLPRVFEMRGTRSSQLPTVNPDFVPGFDKAPRLP